MTLLRFQTFGTTHLALIAFFVLVFVGVCVWGARHGDDQRLRRTWAILIPCFTVPMQIAQLMPGDFTLGTSLPLQYCDLAWVIAAYALWTRRRWAVTLTFFWGLTLTTQGIITPSLEQDFPDPRWFMFWMMHFLSVWAAGYLVATGWRPDWRDYRLAALVTALWAAAVMTFNGLTGTNYGYLNRKPASASALDLLPDWPWYVIVEIGIVLGVWALLTRILRRRTRSDSQAPLGFHHFPGETSPGK